MEIISTNKAPGAIGPYSQAVKSDDYIFCSGQIALSLDGNMVEGGIKEQTKQVLENLEAILEEAGAGLNNIVKSTIYLADINDFADVNEIYGEYFKESPPARATVQVAGLPKSALIEIDVIAKI